MSLLPELRFGWDTTWWCTALFMGTNVLLLAVLPAHYRRRVLVAPGFGDGWERVIGVANFLIFQALTWSAVVLGMSRQASLTWSGALLFAAGYIGYVAALITYGLADPDRPVTSGIYRLSRNPQQLMAVVMWIGVGLMAGSWLVLGVCALQLVTVYPTFIAQERWCTERYGTDYVRYLNKAPRYFLVV